MRQTYLAMFSLAAFSLLLGGCASAPQPTGFISNYSNLQEVSATRKQYIGPGIGQYDKFLIEPVEIVMYDQDHASKLSPEDRQQLEDYMQKTIRTELAKRYQIVDEPGPGVAIVRIAITDVKACQPVLKIEPHTKLLGLGRGEASGEMEIVDAITKRQLAAWIRAGQGEWLSLPFTDLAKWDDAKTVMNDWAKAMREQIDAAHAERNEAVAAVPSAKP